jgi:hypothetical protein
VTVSEESLAERLDRQFVGLPETYYPDSWWSGSRALHTCKACLVQGVGDECWMCGKEW